MQLRKTELKNFAHRQAKPFIKKTEILAVKIYGVVFL